VVPFSSNSHHFASSTSSVPAFAGDDGVAAQVEPAPLLIVVVTTGHGRAHFPAPGGYRLAHRYRTGRFLGLRRRSPDHLPGLRAVALRHHSQWHSPIDNKNLHYDLTIVFFFFIKINKFSRDFAICPIIAVR